MADVGRLEALGLQRVQEAMRPRPSFGKRGADPDSSCLHVPTLKRVFPWALVVGLGSLQWGCALVLFMTVMVQFKCYPWNTDIPSILSQQPAIEV